MEKKKKPKIGFFALTSCEGCEVSLLDLGEEFFDFLKNEIDLVEFHLIEEMPFPKGKIDIAFVEGLPLRKEEIFLLKKIRKKAKILVSLGNCATLGGIPEIRNYQKKLNPDLPLKESPEVKELKEIVKVDFSIPGCPINGKEFLKYAKILVKEMKIPQIPQKPICSECPWQGTNNCFLKKKEPCLGPITLFGCGAICPQNNSLCYGCRGFLKGANIKKYLNLIKTFKSAKEIEENLEIFGLKDEINNPTYS